MSSGSLDLVLVYDSRPCHCVQQRRLSTMAASASSRASCARIVRVRVCVRVRVRVRVCVWGAPSCCLASASNATARRPGRARHLSAPSPKPSRLGRRVHMPAATLRCLVTLGSDHIIKCRACTRGGRGRPAARAALALHWSTLAGASSAECQGALAAGAQHKGGSVSGAGVRQGVGRSHKVWCGPEAPGTCRLMPKQPHRLIEYTTLCAERIGSFHGRG